MQGTLNSLANSPYTIQFFSNQACDASGNGEGETFLGAVSVNTDAEWQRGHSLVRRDRGQIVTATATSSAGNTSEFSACVTVPAGPTTFTVSSTSDSGPGSLRQAILDANASVATLDTIRFNFAGTGPFSIVPTSALPVITDAVIIDGTTQPGYAGDAAHRDRRLELRRSDRAFDQRRQLDRSRPGDQPLQRRRDPAGDERRQRDRGELHRHGYKRHGGAAEHHWHLRALDQQPHRRYDGRRGQRHLGQLGGGINVNGTGNAVQGNRIGTNRAGTAALPNGLGVIVNGANNTIGGTSAGAGNLISGNTNNAISVGPGATVTSIHGNLVGTDAAGTAALPNGGYGVLLEGSGTNVGGTAAGAANVIANNGLAGVKVDSGTSHLIAANAIFNNGGLGIDLGLAGVTPNDPGDTDGGPNTLQNFPVLTGRRRRWRPGNPEQHG